MTIRKYVLQRINSNDRVVINNRDVSYTCGRGKENQIICPSMFVSRNHCIFIIQSDGLYIRDLNSSNGVFVNGEKKVANTLLKIHDKIGIGVPELEPTENSYYVYSLYIQEVENLEPVAGGSTNGIEVKVEPGENNIKSEIVEDDSKKKRPSEDKVGNPSKKQKTFDPVPSTSSANFNIDKRDSIKLEVEDEIEIVNVISLSDKKNQLTVESAGSSGVGKAIDRMQVENIEKNGKVGRQTENGKCTKKSNITNIEKISRDKALDINSLKQNSGINNDLNATVKNRFQNSSNPCQSTNCDKPVLPSTSSDTNVTSVKVEADEDIVCLEDIENTTTPQNSKVPLKDPQLLQMNNNQSSISKLVKLKTVRNEPTTCYSQVDIVSLSSDEEDDDHLIFPCSQLFNVSNDEPPIKKEEIEMEKNEIKEDYDDNVITLSDSDEEDNNPWFNKLYNSQVYRPSQDFHIKDEPDDEIIKTSADEESEKKNHYTSESEILQRNEIFEVDEQDDDVWDETIQSQQTASQEIKNESIDNKKIQHRKSSAKQDVGKSREKEIRKINDIHRDEFSDVEADMNLALEISGFSYKNRRENEIRDENLQKTKKHSSHKIKKYQDIEKRKDSKDEKYKKRRRSSADDSEGNKKSIDERQLIKTSVKEKKEKQINFKNNQERQKTFDQESSKQSIEERKRQTTVEDRKRRKTGEYCENGQSDHERRQTIDQEKRKGQSASEERKEKKRGSEFLENRDNDQERRSTSDQESLRHSLDGRKKQSVSETGKVKTTSEYLDNREKKKKSWEDELLNIEEKVLTIKPKPPARKAIVIEPLYMVKSDKRRTSVPVFKNNNDNNNSNETSNERNEESENEISKITPPRKRSRSRSRKSQENLFKETNQGIIPNYKEKRKEKLKELSAKRSLRETNSNMVPCRKSKGIAKVTHKSRQDSLLFEQQKAASIKPGIAHQRTSNTSPIAHCSKFIPESTTISTNKREEKCQNSEIKLNHKERDYNYEKHDRKELSNNVTLNVPPISSKSSREKKENNENRKPLKSCLSRFGYKEIKKKKKVRFNDKNCIKTYEIEECNSLNRVVGKDAPMNRNKSQIEPHIDEYLSRIFDWNPAWLSEQKKLPNEPPVYKGDHLQKIKTHYSSFLEYSNFFRPLLLLEMWNTLSKESECEEKKTKFRQRYCSVVQNSVTKNKTLTGEFQTNLLIEMLVSKEDFDRELYPGPGHLLLFEYPFYDKAKDQNGSFSKKLQFRWIFAFVKSKTRTEITAKTRFNRKLMEFTPNSQILITLFVLCKNAIEPATDHVCRIRGAMYLKANMRDILALQNLPKSRLRSLILTPNLEDYKLPEAEQIPLVTKDDLNERQIEAVMRVSKAALTEKPQISLIHGPPGTGKSKVIVNTVIQILSENPKTQILVCAPSNAAVDELALRLLQIRTNLEFKSIKMVRVGRPEAMNVKVRNISLTELGRKQVEKDFLLNKNDQKTIKENNAEKQKLDALLELVENRIEDIKRNGVKGDLNQLYRQRQSLQNSIKTLRTKIEQRVDFKSLSLAEKNKINRETEELVLSKATVIACTLSSCYSGMMEKIFGGKEKLKIPICIVDEATQCCEPENLIPLMLGVNKLILVGDTNQLPATVISKKAKEHGLDQSLFARLQKAFANENDNPVIMLNTQYRMDFPILSWPNSYFYQGKLIDKATVKVVPYSSYRVLNLNSFEDETKFSNTGEAEFVSKIIFIMITSIDVSSFKETLQIGVITPYQNQRNVVLSKIETRLKPVSTNRRSKFIIDVNTVDSFQGQEKDVIVMSCVRSNGIGFMSDKQRLCVALTRAKSSLILCGNFKTFQKDEMWNQLLTDARRRGILMDVNVNASMNEIKNHVLR
ncbi:probable helicase senataxin [Leptopilina heterotoma]|uniref:probable helicase senataxin n=1 Tax=Leptopilina heterotoma TaxID=63436 RepID=UPI001CA7BEC2|nr:probable helicase senataxin [Leptopilina heterotoma]